MIGQKENLAIIDRLIYENRIPNFILVLGAKRTGKKLFVSEIVKKLNMTAIEVGKGINDVKEVVDTVNDGKFQRVYCVYDLEDYHYRSVEAILKLCEEPPEYSFLIITSNGGFLKDTIKNRAFVIRQSIYTYDEMLEYIKMTGINYKMTEFAYNIIRTPSLFTYYLNDGRLKQYKEFFKKFDNIMKVSATNSLKASEYFNLKENENDKIDFWLFLDWLSVMLSEFSKVKNIDFSLLCHLILKYKEYSYINGINLYSIVNTFIIMFRRCVKKMGIEFVDVFAPFLELL